MFENYRDLLAFTDALPDAETIDDIVACSYSDIVDDISMVLVDYRMQHNLSQVELAKKLSISQTMVSQYESGARNISVHTLCSLMAKIGKKVTISFENTIDSLNYTPAFDSNMELANEVQEELAICA